ncbi:MAG: hypothetical protein LBL13_09075, partial [Bacteroidales bacterium]|nr:hypothetical protein [Bacteroidales bacterium]
MKKLVLSITFIFALGVNLFGQIHKDEKNRPMSSTHYVFQNNDSIKDNETVYTYNSNKQLIEEVIYSSDNSISSTLISYDANNRIISSDQYINGRLSYSEAWNYDEPNKLIDHSYSIEFSDSLSHIIYRGVNDFEEPFTHSLFGSFLDELLGTTMIDCDSVELSTYEESSSSWITMKIYPKYQNGKIVSAKMYLNNFDASAFGLEGQLVNALVDYTFTYKEDNLTKADMSMTMDIL